MDKQFLNDQAAHKLAMDIYKRCLNCELLKPIADEINRLAARHPGKLERIEVDHDG